MSESTRRVGSAPQLTSIGLLVLFFGLSGSCFAGIGGTDTQGIGGTDTQGIGGTDTQGIGGTDTQGIGGTDTQGIGGTDTQGIGGTDTQGIGGTDLLIIGSVDFISGDFASILGQSVFSDSLVSADFGVGDTVAVYGSIDQFTGGIVDSRVVAIAAGSSESFLTGIVDQVDATLGVAVVSGVAVNYTALLGDGAAPAVGQRVAVSGRVYNGIGMIAEQR